MLINNESYRTIWFDRKKEEVKIIDQTKLPFYLEIVSLNNLEDVINAINLMQVRGAPLIGATAAYGVYLAYRNLKDKNKIIDQANKIKNTRPTAINLFWAVDNMLSVIKDNLSSSEIEKSLLDQANKICEDDINRCKKIGELGFKIIESLHNKKGKVNILTHCNAGVAVDDNGLASAKHWDSIWKINVLQHTNIVRHSISKMLENKSGWFLITASAAGLLSQVGSATYSTTKHATVGFAEWLSITYGEKNIGVSLLCPQGVNTPMTEKIKDGGVAGINGMLELIG